MASLKEIRSRIVSVTSTKKITSAMKMVSAAKLHKTEEQARRFLPYRDKLTQVLGQYLGTLEGETAIPLASRREVRKAVVVAIASNSGLCGTYNSSVFKLFTKTVEEYRKAGVELEVIAIGKKMGEHALRCGYTTTREYDKMTDKLSYESAFELARKLSDRFLSGECDEVKVVYNHFKNAGVQIPTAEVYLPLQPVADTGADRNQLYFTEPDPATFIAELVPMVVRIRMYSILLDASASEHGARTTAMQVASDNAEKMIGEITQLYNRARQEVITNELLDIVGGSEALRNS
ncbi:MAG: ATP synthase F1 subunit gamma [Paludibacteraceae bacterium]|nr:ATP synthase F1 subunit gamma [Paludibacteraceae bacterium]